MIKQDWMVIIAGNDLVEAMSAETKARCPHTGSGYASEPTLRPAARAVGARHPWRGGYLLQLRPLGALR
jgi:hypothetical protein